VPEVKRSTPKRKGLTAEQVVNAVIWIVDQEGVDALTIRRLADACGLSPMGVYRHVRDKQDLLDRVVDAVVSPGLQDLHVSGPWDKQVADLIRYARRLNLEHPGVAVLCVLGPTPVLGVARFYARVLEALGGRCLSGGPRSSTQRIDGCRMTGT
jgi:AcrR family transcriptional regulator